MDVRRPLSRLPAALLLALWACGGPEPAERTAPRVALPEDGPPAPVVRTLRLALRMDERFALVADAPERARRRVEVASAVLARQVGLGLHVASLGPFPPVPDPVRAGELLERLEAAADPEADVTVLFAAATAMEGTRAEHVAARFTGRAVVVRSLAARFDPSDTDALLAAEATLLLHGLGTIFGALPVCGDPIVSAELPPRPATLAFSPFNERLLLVHRSLDLRPEIAPRLSPESAKAALATLDAASPIVRRCAARELEARQRMLAAVLAPPAPPPVLPPAPPGETPEQAWTRCHELASRHPDSEAARCAGLAAVATNRTEEAIRFLRAWLVAHPDDPEVVLALARAVGRGGDDGAARGLLADFAQRHPGHVSVWINLGVAEARLGRLAEARAAWEAALRLEPGNPDARALLDGLPKP